MNTKTPRQDSEKDDKVPVTAIGNSWIVCKSKSYAGRVYYFNTLTGEAAWNLSDAEMEKAKKTTNILIKQPQALYEGCPEPKDPPSDSVHTIKRSHSQQTCSLISQPQQLTTNQISPERPQESSVNTVLFNCPVNAMNAHPAPILFNPNVWALPPNHQLVLAPAPQTTTSLSVAYNNLEQHATVQDLSLLRGFNTLNRPRGKRNLRFNRVFNKRSPRRNYLNVGQRQTNSYQNNNFNSFSTANDLRQLLSAKRERETKSFESKVQKVNKNDKILNDNNTDSKQKIKIIKLNSEELHASDADDQWLRTYGEIEGTQLKLNVKPIKDIVILDENIDCWYIVADASTLMDHFNFISIVVGSDEKCQLMISDDTMAELQAISRSDDLILMRRACLVLRLLDTGHAVLGKDYSDDTSEKSILHFTIKLAEQNHNVVLLSNNIETTETDYGINIFTIEQVKDIIANTPVEAKSQVQDFPNSSRIKISVPNNTNYFDSLTIEKTEANSVYDENSKEKDANDGEDNLMSIGVQTEEELEDTACNTFSVPFNIDSLPVNSKDTITKVQREKANTVAITEDETKNANHPPKIRLKRNTSVNQTTVSNESNVTKKQFKWRRRKKNIDTETTKESKQPNPTLDICNDNANLCPAFTDNVDADNIYSDKAGENNKISNKDPQPDNCSETTSGSCFIVKENSKIVIEETSTSGIISNTPSIVDSESFNSTKQRFIDYIPHDSYNKKSNKCIMYEVENSVMEEHLKIRSDEWLSRFVQIMEDILTQVLRMDPPFIHSSLPPPWTLHEATECIKRKFHTENEITDAASKLADFLYRNSDKKKGKLNSPLEPRAFMEMYSYGVYLVESLQAIITDCKDLQSAIDSLTKLLTEIEDPNEYDPNNDSLIEELDNLTPSVSLCVSDNATEKESNSTYNHRKEDAEQLERSSDKNDQNSNRKYNLRSSQRSPGKIPESNSVTFKRNIDVESNFFSSLALTKKPFASPKKNTETEKISNDLVNSPKQISERDNNETNNTEKVSTGPKIIRNFSKHMEFEERLKRSDYFNSMSYNDDGLDYEEGNDELDYAEDELDYAEDEVDYAEGEDGDFAEEIEYTEGGDEVDEEGLEEGELRDEDDYYNEDIGDDPNVTSKTEKQEKYNSEKNGNINFNMVAGKIVHELRQSYIQVHTFCANVCNELKSSAPLNPARRILIREEAETAKMDLDKLIKYLNSIVVREEKECGSSIHSVLQKSGVIFDYGQAVEYRNAIAKCAKQACVLLDSVNIVLEAVK